MKDATVAGEDPYNAAGAVDRMPALHHLALMVHQDQVRHPDLREVHRHRVGPVQVRMLRIADGQVPGEAVVEPLARKGPAGAHQPLLEVLAGAGHIVELGNAGEDQAGLVRLVDGHLRVHQRVVKVFLLAEGFEFFEQGGHGSSPGVVLCAG